MKKRKHVENEKKIIVSSRAKWGESPADWLPEEAWQHILMYAPVEDITRYQLVCKRFAAIANEPHVRVDLGNSCWRMHMKATC